MYEDRGRPTVAEVSLSALRANCRQARKLVSGQVSVMAVVKADGYGHGATAAGRAFVAAGASALGVSTVVEGLELRRGGLDGPIVVLGGAFAGEEAAVVAHGLDCTVWTVESARALSAAAHADGTRVRLHVKIDTGMTRLGLDLADVQAFGEAVALLPGARWEGACSHFASADAVDTASAQAQTDRFREAVSVLAAAGIHPPHVHLANSAAVLSKPDAHFTMVRPGLMLYGYPPAPHLGARATLTRAMRLRSGLLLTRRVSPGTRVGYGGDFVAARPSVIGVVPIGYADGYHRRASNRAEIVVRGRRAPVAGRVCMDQVMIDVTDVPGAAAGDAVELFGPRLGADELAGWCDTIPYEMLTSVGKRVPRAHVEDFDA
jgi:alanine racemase